MVISKISNLGNGECACCNQEYTIYTRGTLSLEEQDVYTLSITHQAAESETVNHAFHLRCLAIYLKQEMDCPICHAKILDTSSLGVVNDSRTDLGYILSKLSAIQIYTICELSGKYITEKPPKIVHQLYLLSSARCKKDDAGMMAALQELELHPEYTERTHELFQGSLYYSMRMGQFEILEHSLRRCFSAHTFIPPLRLKRALLLTLDSDHLSIFELIVENAVVKGAHAEEILARVIDGDRAELLAKIWSPKIGSTTGVICDESELESVLTKAILEKKLWVLKICIEQNRCSAGLRKSLLKAAVLAADFPVLDILFTCEGEKTDQELLLIQSREERFNMVQYLHDKILLISPEYRGRAITQAIISKDLAIASFLLTKVQGGEFSAETLKSTVERAVYQNSFKMVDSLLQPEIVNCLAPPSLEATCQHFWDSALLAAVGGDNAALVDELCQKKRFTEAVLNSAILQACIRGNLKILEKLESVMSQQGFAALRTIRTEEIMEVITTCCKKGNVVGVRWLLKQRALLEEILQTAKEEWIHSSNKLAFILNRALEEAVTNGHPHIVEILLPQMDKIVSSDKLLLVATAKGYREIISLLHTASTNPLPATIFFKAVEAGDPQTFQLLLELQKDSSIIDMSEMFDRLIRPDHGTVLLEIFLNSVGRTIADDARAYAIERLILYLPNHAIIQRLCQGARFTGKQLSLFISQVVLSIKLPNLRDKILEDLLVTTECSGELELEEAVIGIALGSVGRIWPSSSHHLGGIVTRLLRAHDRTQQEWENLTAPFLSRAIRNNDLATLESLLKFEEISLNLKKECLVQAEAEGSSAIQKLLREKIPPPVDPILEQTRVLEETPVLEQTRVQKMWAWCVKIEGVVRNIIQCIWSWCIKIVEFIYGI